MKQKEEENFLNEPDDSLTTGTGLPENAFRELAADEEYKPAAGFQP